MKAAIYRRYGPPEVVQLEDVEKPTPKDDEILIEVHATTVCATDALVRRGAYLMFRLFLGILKPRKPIIAGVEFSGRVVEVGKSASRFKVESRKRMLMRHRTQGRKRSHSHRSLRPALGSPFAPPELVGTIAQD